MGLIMVEFDVVKGVVIIIFRNVFDNLGLGGFRCGYNGIGGLCDSFVQLVFWLMEESKIVLQRFVELIVLMLEMIIIDEDLSILSELVVNI